MEALKFPDAERDREQRVSDLLADQGSGWEEGYRPGSFGCHELLDRAALVAALAERQLLSHPACIQDPDWYALAEQAVTALEELYQRIGEKHLGALDATIVQP
jgi:hypothetical protein